MNKQLLSVDEAAAYLGIGKHKMRAIMNAGHVQILKMGPSGTKIPVIELDRFVRENLSKDFTDVDNVKEIEVEGGEWCEE
jgi:excisionase family DNA binding protein